MSAWATARDHTPELGVLDRLRAPWDVRLREAITSIRWWAPSTGTGWSTSSASAALVTGRAHLASNSAMAGEQAEGTAKPQPACVGDEKRLPDLADRRRCGRRARLSSTGRRRLVPAPVLLLRVCSVLTDVNVSC